MLPMFPDTSVTHVPCGSAKGTSRQRSQQNAPTIPPHAGSKNSPSYHRDGDRPVSTKVVSTVLLETCLVHHFGSSSDKCAPANPTPCLASHADPALPS